MQNNMLYMFTKTTISKHLICLLLFKPLLQVFTYLLKGILAPQSLDHILGVYW